MPSSHLFANGVVIAWLLQMQVPTFVVLLCFAGVTLLMLATPGLEYHTSRIDPTIGVEHIECSCVFLSQFNVLFFAVATGWHWMYQSELILVSLIIKLFASKYGRFFNENIYSIPLNPWKFLIKSIRFRKNIPINIPSNHQITMFKIPLSPHKIPLISIHFQVPQIVFRPGASAEHLGWGHGDRAWENFWKLRQDLGGLNRMLSMGLIYVYI